MNCCIPITAPVQTTGASKNETEREQPPLLPFLKRGIPMSKDYGAFVTQDRSKCTGCKACELVCFTAHTNGLGKTVGTVSTPVISRLFVTETEDGCAPVQCRHCEDAPCLNACQRNAIIQYEHQLIINTQKCEHCNNPVCASACPFGAIRLMPLPAKCDLCIGEENPACVHACPNQALRLVKLEEERQQKNANAARWLSYMG